LVHNVLHASSTEYTLPFFHNNVLTIGSQRTPCIIQQGDNNVLTKQFFHNNVLTIRHFFNNSTTITDQPFLILCTLCIIQQGEEGGHLSTEGSHRSCASRAEDGGGRRPIGRRSTLRQTHRWRGSSGLVGVAVVGVDSSEEETDGRWLQAPVGVEETGSRPV
jgi:hypothetical protein